MVAIISRISRSHVLGVVVFFLASVLGQEASAESRSPLVFRVHVAAHSFTNRLKIPATIFLGSQPYNASVHSFAFLANGEIHLRGASSTQWVIHGVASG
jgi:hypothetical protein